MRQLAHEISFFANFRSTAVTHHELKQDMSDPRKTLFSRVVTDLVT